MVLVMLVLLLLLMVVVVVHNVAPCTAVGLNGALSSAQGLAGGVYMDELVYIASVYSAAADAAAMARSVNGPK